MGAAANFKAKARKSGTRFRAFFLASSSNCPCGAGGDPYVYEKWHAVHPEEPDCGGTGKIIAESSQEFYGFVLPVQDQEKEQTVAGVNTTEKATLYWPGDIALDASLRIEKLNRSGMVVTTFTGADYDFYEVNQEEVARVCTLTEVSGDGQG